MALKPILFSTDMVQAILEGRKKVTRRVIKPQPKMRLSYCCGGYRAGKWNYPSENVYKYWGDEWRIPEGIILTDDDKDRLWTPPCHTGDVLYVREAWAPLYEDYSSKEVCGFLYKADRDMLYGEEYEKYYDSMYPAGKNWCWEGRWKPSIHMPLEAARLFLKVSNVTVDRLHNMRIQDSLDEGVKLSLDGLMRKGEPALAPFSRKWDSTIPKKALPVYGWNADPYVWVIEFERCEKPLQDKDGNFLWKKV